VETVTRIDGGSRAGDAPASVSFRVDDGLASRLGVVVGGGVDERGETLAGVRCGVGLGGTVGARKNREESSTAHRGSIIPSLREGTSALPGEWCRGASARTFRRAE